MFQNIRGYLTALYSIKNEYRRHSLIPTTRLKEKPVNNFITFWS